MHVNIQRLDTALMELGANAVLAVSGIQGVPKRAFSSWVFAGGAEQKPMVFAESDSHE